jgi:Xaa-Pro aminopeptidase
VKRGLVVLDPAETPAREFAQRVSTLQRRIAGEGVDVALVYGDVSRSEDIGYLTNLCIYWNEGMVAVPVAGDPVFLTKLSPRVHSWMRRTSTVSDLRSGRSFGELVAAMLAGRAGGVVGLVDSELWPAAVGDEVRGALAGWQVRPLGPIVRDQRAVPSAAQLRLLRAGARILAGALGDVCAPGLAVAERVAMLELALRGGGFTDVLVETTALDEGSVTLEITGEYRHGWVHASRVAHSGAVGPPWLPALEAALNAVVGAVRPGATPAALALAAQPARRRLPGEASLDIRCVDQADLATNGELRPVGDGGVCAGAVLATCVELRLPGVGRAVVADTVLVTVDGAERLTATAQPAGPAQPDGPAR